MALVRNRVKNLIAWKMAVEIKMRYCTKYAIFTF